MLHGWTQNAEVFRSKTHPFVRKVEKVTGTNGSRVDLVWATAPHHLPVIFEGQRENARAWFYYDAEDRAKLVDVFAPVRREYHGWAASRAYLGELWLEHGPFDVLCGFSQGAVVTHQLLQDIESVIHHSDSFGGVEAALRSARFLPCDSHASQMAGWSSASTGRGEDSAADTGSTAQHTQQQLDNENASAESHRARPWSRFKLSPGEQCMLEHPPRAAILVAGFPSRHTHGLPPGTLLRTPSLHISASNDATVAPQHQEQLRDMFQDPSFHRTEQGHTMPQRAADLAVVCQWLRAISKQ